MTFNIFIIWMFAFRTLLYMYMYKHFITLLKVLVFERQTQWTLCPIYSYMYCPTTYNYIYQSLRGWTAAPHTEKVHCKSGPRLNKWVTAVHIMHVTVYTKDKRKNRFAFLDNFLACSFYSF